MVKVVLRRVGGSVGLRKAKHLVELDAHLQANQYLSAKAVAYWVKETFGVSYTESGMTAVLHRLGYVRLVPGKADREAQTKFFETYDHIRNIKGQDDPINADSGIALFEQLVAFHPMAVCIYVICDNAP